MDSTSRQALGLDIRLVQIEEFLRQNRAREAFTALDHYEGGGRSPSGLDHGLYCLLCAERALVKNDYKGAMAYCQQAMDEFGDSSLNNRIGRVQILLYRVHAALGDLKSAEMSARDALASYRRIKDPIGIIDAYNALGRIYYLRSDYAMAAEYVNEAIQYIGDDLNKKSQLIGNLGRIHLLTGDLIKAEENLRLALEISRQLDIPLAIVRNYLSLGYLYLRRRQFQAAELELQQAYSLIIEHDCKREQVICREYQGELAYEKLDYVAARAYLTEAIALADHLAPESTLASQSLRRLADVERELGHHDEAMRLAQKALDLAQSLGEKIEIGLAHRVISQVFLSRHEIADSRRHGLEGIEILRNVGDQYELGRSIICVGAIPPSGTGLADRKTYPLLQEAEQIFTLLGDDYYLARCRFELGRFCHRIGKNGEALDYLKEAARGFRVVGDVPGANLVNEFLTSLSQSAVSRALSAENEFKIFGNLVSNSEYSNLKSGPLDRLLDVLVQRTGASRAFIIDMAQGEFPVIMAAAGLDESHHEIVGRAFGELLHDRISADAPTLILDCSLETDFSDLAEGGDHRIASLIVLPLTLGAETAGYIYLDRLTGDAGKEINPFSQKEIDFAVGFADLAAFKIAEYQKEKLLEDNIRLKAQLLEKCVFPNIITQSRVFMEMLARVRQVANSNMTITILGETGTGKDLLAKAIHYNSGRRDKRLISVNCAALPESLLESELFGYKKGAFTGADRDKPGLFEEADGGTFFLDEIADMPPSIQAKILRVLENKEITRLGDTRPRTVDVRVISATNKDLKIEMEERRFRSDLYYRLCALQFQIPPLNERREDIPLLVNHFLADSKCQMSPEAMRYLMGYDWPGNVRELENEVKKLVLLANNEGLITPSLLSARILGDSHINFDAGPAETDFYAMDGFSLYDYLAEYEKRFIIRALKENGCVKKRAADALHIPESTLRLKLKQYDIDTRRLEIN